MKLDADDRTVLAALGAEPRPVDALADELDVPPDELDDRLRELADNGLVADLGEGRYRRTDSGRRVLATSSGATDNRIDTTPAVERTLAAFDLGPDEAEAVRGVYAFLRYWGRATPDELVDAIYGEDPAGYASGDEWWTGCVREPLSALPDVRPPSEPTASWRYVGAPEAATPGADGTRRLARPGRQPYGSVKHALESLPLAPAEREAVRAAFGVLRRRGAASEPDIAAATYPAHPAGHPTPEAWWDGLVRDAFRRLPGVTYGPGGVWRYRQRIGRVTSRERRRPEP
ncbi:helix-turn-helix transcriptional regulator (plasmid) [Halorarum salinum]|uniref:Helix-turn-helix transcriptional regulator n=1 Tax=Halorarum salinum TaxID=2743089 RepID=A0A7D5QEM4_9EURY|nr:helix-turn-helix domain-containing protein [Halobaculum salinum]QLG64220.1 helix-turn-helix transcriptional regulator [Halobaculum salinum]